MNTTLNTILQLSMLVLGLLTFPVHSASDYSQYNPSQLIFACQSNDALVVDRAIKDLQRIPYSGFQTEHKKSVSQLLKKDVKHLNRLIKLAGFLQMESELLELNSELLQNKEIKQAWNLALVRSGNGDKKQTLLKNIEKLELDDRFAYDIAPTLVYVRQKEIMDQLLDRIMEEGDTCSPPDLDTRGTVSCAYSIIEQIAPYVYDFPVEMDRYGIKTDNYEGMLQGVRSWIRDNKTQYKMNLERY